MREINFSFIADEQTDIDSKFSTFINHLYKCYNETYQIKTKILGSKRIQNPWLTVGLLNSINQKHKLYRNYKQNIIPFQLYLNYETYLKTLLKKAKRNYYSEKFIATANDSKGTWSLINSIINKSTKSTQSISELKINNEISNDKKIIADTLNNYFINIGSDILAASPPSHTDFTTYLPNCNSQFSFNNINPLDIKCVISGLKNKKCDISCIPNHKYKLISDIISTPLANLFNASLLSGIFPNILKVSRVTPLFKKEDPSLPKNYRPISITHTISKLLEKIVFKQLTEYLNTNTLLNDLQFGFRTERSTSDALICLTEKL